MKTRWMAAAFVLTLISAFQAAGQTFNISGTAALDAVPAFALGSSAFEDGAVLPQKYTADGDNVSPPLAWCNPPLGVKSWVATVVDPDAPSGDWIHWIVYDIPAFTTYLDENAGAQGGANLPTGAKHGYNSWYDFNMGGDYYQGAEPPPGESHLYRFRLYGLDVASLAVTPPAVKLADITAAMQGHVVTQRDLVASYPDPLAGVNAAAAGEGTPIEGVVVNGGALGSRLTDKCGYFVFSSVPAGTVFNVTADLAGYTFEPSAVGGTLTADVVADFVATQNVPSPTPTPTPGPGCYTLTAKAKPAAGGAIKTKPAQNCGSGWSSGTSLTLKAKAKPGYRFVRWKGDVSGKQKKAALVMDGNKSVKAKFAAE